MSWPIIITLLFGSLLLLMALGVPVGMAFLGVTTVAAYFIYGRFRSLDDNLAATISQLADNAFAQTASFALVAIPMFLLMGELFFHSGLGTRMFDAIDRLLGGIPGRLCYVAVAGGTGFAALSGSSMASTAILGKLMIPEMTTRGYERRMAIGPVLGTGALAVLIPPSTFGVLLGTMANLDIARLLIAGILPGLLLAAIYVGLILFQVTSNPDRAPLYDMPVISLSTKIGLFAANVLPMVSIIAAVVFLMMMGVATAAESAAYGAAAVFVLYAVYELAVPAIRLVTSKDLQARSDSHARITAFRRGVGRVTLRSLEGSARITVLSLLIVFGSALYGNVMAASGASENLVRWALSLETSPYALLGMMIFILLFLGAFMDELAVMLLTVPLFFPTMAGLDFGMPDFMQPIWFGTIVLVTLQIGFVAPPLGMLIFVMQGVAPAGTTYWDICRAVMPYIYCMLLLVALIIIFPQIALWLPFSY